MKYFKYLSKISMLDVWSLFTQMANEDVQSKLMSGKLEFGHTYQIVSVAMKGGLDRENFNLIGYELGCEKIDKTKQLKDKTMHIIDHDNLDDPLPQGTVAESTLSSKTTEMFDKEEEIAFDEDILMLFSMRSKYQRDNGVDIVRVLLNSLYGVPESISLLKELMKKDDFLFSLVVGLCENKGILKSRIESELEMEDKM